MVDINKTMEEAAKLLEDLGASYEHPGFISIEESGLHFRFGDAGGDFGYDYGDKNDPSDRTRGDETCTCHASSLELAEFITRILVQMEDASDKALK